MHRQRLVGFYDEKQVKAGRRFVLHQPERLADAALDQVPPHRRSASPADGNADACRLIVFAPEGMQGERMGGFPFAGLENRIHPQPAAKALGAGQPIARFCGRRIHRTIVTPAPGAVTLRGRRPRIHSRDMNKRLLRLGVAVAISVVAFGCALAIAALIGRRADDVFYDGFYRLRPAQDMTHADVVLVAADDKSIEDSGKPWPWPRKYWGDIATYLDHAGARAIAFDIIFPNPSYYGDDDAFAAAMNALKAPVIYGSQVQPDGSWQSFAPQKISGPSFGAVNLGADRMYRAYPPELNGQPSLAEMATVSAGLNLDDLQRQFAPLDQKFLLHYYGPHLLKGGAHTFQYVPAWALVQAQENATAPAAKATGAISPEMFKGKIVIICAIALGAYDLKSSPLDNEYPGPEVQATAMENLLHDQKVLAVPSWVSLLAAAGCALFATAGIVFPRRASLKVAAPVIVTLLLFALAIHLFRAEPIRWLSPVSGLLAILISSPLAFGWTFFTEDRQRRFMLRALSKVVSPAVAEQLSQDPERLALGTQRTEITVIFTDLANFTDLSEGMDVQDLGRLINRYLGEMSTQVFQQDGTLDKYIGDAVMAFWNAPLPQEDHAVRACRAALHMIAREKQLHAEFSSLGTRRIHTRIGINTTSAAVGFIGSEHLFNYTAMGDGVNLASRMEGANKIYDTQILISESTAAKVRAFFHLRQMDVLRVKGKQQPMPVYELLAEKAGSANPDLEERIGIYENAFTAYQAREWDRAAQQLLELSRRFGEDGPAEKLLARVREYRTAPPPADWDGVHVSKTK